MSDLSLPTLLAGVFNLGFAVFHLFFWRLFRWQEELPRLGAVNRDIVQILNLCLTYLLALCAAACLLFPWALIATEMGRFLLLGMTGFWLMRAIFQSMFFGLRHPLSASLFALFIAGALLHGWAWGIGR